MAPGWFGVPPRTGSGRSYGSRLEARDCRGSAQPATAWALRRPSQLSLQPRPPLGPPPLCPVLQTVADLVEHLDPVRGLRRRILATPTGLALVCRIKAASVFPPTRSTRQAWEWPAPPGATPETAPRSALPTTRHPRNVRLPPHRARRPVSLQRSARACRAPAGRSDITAAASRRRWSPDAGDRDHRWSAALAGFWNSRGSRRVDRGGRRPRGHRPPPARVIGNPTCATCRGDGPRRRRPMGVDAGPRHSPSAASPRVEGPVLAHGASLRGGGASLPRRPWPSRGPCAPSSAAERG